MSRAVEFDVDTALASAMTAFRHRGFAGTSIKALERATGLSSGSLYNSFGDKDAIFEKAVSHYNRVVVAEHVAEHLNGKPPADGLRAFFLALLDEPDGGSSGCLLTNSAVEFGPGDSTAKDAVRAGLELEHEALLAAVRAQRPDDADAALTALRLLALYQGVLVLIRFGHPKPRLRAMIMHEFDSLKGEGDVQDAVGTVLR